MIELETRKMNFIKVRQFLIIFVGDWVYLIARGVSALVVVSALMVLFLLMSMLRVLLKQILKMFGLFGIVVMITFIMVGCMRYANLPPRMIKILITRSCH